MEENKLNLEFIEPEVKVVAVASQRVLCQSQEEEKDKSISIDQLTEGGTLF